MLVSDEMHAGKLITKFPGGGLQFGESTHECLQREFMEELQLDIAITDHFYTVDFFQASAFDSSQQVISIYYRVKNESDKQIIVTDKIHPTSNKADGDQAFRWVSLQSIVPEEFTFPIDQKVGVMLNEFFKARK